jgi:hypothetical protein
MEGTTRVASVSSAAAHAQIDDLVEELRLVAAGAHETYRDLALNLAIALHHRRDPDAPCWQSLYVLLALELAENHAGLGEALKRFLVAVDAYDAARSPDTEHGSDREHVSELRTASAALDAGLADIRVALKAWRS